MKGAVFKSLMAAIVAMSLRSEAVLAGKADAPLAFITSQQPHHNNNHHHNRMALSLQQLSSGNHLPLLSMSKCSSYHTPMNTFALSASADEEPDVETNERAEGVEDEENDNGNDHDGGDDDDDDDGSMPPPKSKRVEDILRDIHRSNLPFRVVVIGNGAILESTNTLTPNFKSSTSPKTNEKLITISNTDQSFEFHVKVDTVSKVTFTETDKKSADGTVLKTLRIVRFLDEMGRPICSLIVADGGTEEGKKWFTNMTIRYGYEVQL